jgi:hypothetical protein
MRIAALALGGSLAWALATACGGGDASRKVDGCDPGTEGCSCLDDGTCNTGLVCETDGDAQQCRASSGSGGGSGAGGGSATGGRTGSGGSSGNTGGQGTTGGSANAGGAGSPDGGPDSSVGTGGSGEPDAGDASTDDAGPLDGSLASGGASGSGGAGGGASAGGASSAGGTASSGGAPGSGGAPAAGGSAASGGAGGSNPAYAVCTSCAIEFCFSERQACQQSDLGTCAPCLANKDAAGCNQNSLFGAYLTCVCGVQFCTEQCSSSCLLP